MKELVAISEARLADTAAGYIRPVRCYFKALGFQAGDLWAPVEYMEWVSKRQAEFFAQRTPGVAAVLAEDFNQWLEELVDSGCCPVPEPAKDSWRYQSRRKGKVKC